MRAGVVHFYYFIMRLAAFQAIIYELTATINSPIAFLACTLIFSLSALIPSSADNSNNSLSYNSVSPLKVLYTNANKFYNKRDDLLMLIAGNEPS